MNKAKDDTQPADQGPVSGGATDNAGRQVIDPTENVKNLSEAANKRQDDLREASERLMLAAIDHVKELATLRSDHSKELSLAEKSRIDAIRAVDVNAVAVANERAVASATVLANQVTQSADALRTLVATTSSALAEQQRQLISALQDRLTSVERAQYEGKGKEAIADPRMDKLYSTVERLATIQAEGQGKGTGANQLWGYIVGAIGVIAVIVNLLMNKG